LDFSADLHAPDALPIGKVALVSMQETEKRKISASSKNRTPNHPSSGVVCIPTAVQYHMTIQRNED
jgi:hypothetical protein